MTLLVEFLGSSAAASRFAMITFGAVLVRRRGPAFAVLGLVGWTGCILRPPVSQLPAMSCAEAVAGVCPVLSSLTLFRHRPRASLRHALRGWHARPRRKRLDRRYARLSTVASTVEGWLAGPASSKDASHALLVRERLLCSEAAVEAHRRLEFVVTTADDPARQVEMAVSACARAGRAGTRRRAMIRPPSSHRRSRWGPAVRCPGRRRWRRRCPGCCTGWPGPSSVAWPPCRSPHCCTGTRFW